MWVWFKQLMFGESRKKENKWKISLKNVLKCVRKAKHIKKKLQKHVGFYKLKSQ